MKSTKKDQKEIRPNCNTQKSENFNYNPFYATGLFPGGIERDIGMKWVHNIESTFYFFVYDTSAIPYLQL